MIFFVLFEYFVLFVMWSPQSVVELNTPPAFSV